MPETAATASNSEPRAAAGWGATSRTAVITEVMNSTRVCAARELMLRDVATAALLTESATNSRPVSAPATAARASPKPSHAVVVYPTGRPPRSSAEQASRSDQRLVRRRRSYAAGRPVAWPAPEPVSGVTLSLHCPVREVLVMAGAGNDDDAGIRSPASVARRPRTRDQHPQGRVRAGPPGQGGVRPAGEPDAQVADLRGPGRGHRRPPGQAYPRRAAPRTCPGAGARSR